MNSPRRLRYETGLLAGKLAALLDRLLPEGVSDGRRFLRAAADQKYTREPAAVDRLQLPERDLELLMFAGMAEEHEGFAAVFRSLSPKGESRPSVGLAAQLFCGNADERLELSRVLHAGKAVASGALKISGDAPFFERTLEPAAGLWPALHGIDFWPPELRRITTPPVNAGLEEWFYANQPAAQAIVGNRCCTVLVGTDTDDSAFERALALVSFAGAEPAAFHYGAAVEDLISLHTVVRGMVPVLRSSSVDSPEFAHHPGTVVIAGAGSVTGKRPLVRVKTGSLTIAARSRMWSVLLPQVDTAGLSARFPVEPAIAAAVATDLSLIDCPTVEDAAAAVRARAGLQLQGGVQLITPTATWEDLVLSDDRHEQLREASARLLLQDRVLGEWGFLKNRSGSRGVRLLFSGPPGTGKTLSAEVLAHSLGVDLLYVDISRVVSKWIGETEKNLSAVFETAERVHAVLMFDEADALFGRRTEVSDAHDRHANLETAYLLSRLERFEGLVILASNLRQNIDPAFLRRVEFSISFDAPDHAERLKLWQVHLPRAAPLASDVNLEEFAARYAVPGAFIRNAATAAGFLAASNGLTINRSHFLHAIRREYEKSGKAFPGS